MSYKKEVQNYLKRFWHLLWRDDSFKGWLFSIVFIFAFVRFIFFPLLIFLTGTPLPLAIVESCSMYHEGNLLSDPDEWWEENKGKYSQFNINKSDFEEFSMRRGFNKGDILFIVGRNPDKLELGDIIVFDANQRHPIIHRIVEIDDSNNGRIFSTLGDNNLDQLPIEREIRESQIMGKAVFKAAPYLGWVKLVFFEWQKPPEKRGFC